MRGTRRCEDERQGVWMGACNELGSEPRCVPDHMVEKGRRTFVIFELSPVGSL